eukprot:gnl/TRDRNA2_/TRDRNA2_86301_c0_seq2.p1 gnl/TRDRNA2_/TRDRNA2_86301_c0~~gnl/TRDRNA2_/TRDRNA2_86301_c0_seq2.p1  ORF type:complete len:169 (+),score=23.05 gnl/TRDRNA2_/TRDRNA2_86301_c0_seq2:62-568(+)
MTDYDSAVLELMQSNIRSNSLGASVSVHRLDFEDTSTYLDRNTFDLVVAADVLYDSTTAMPLARALEAHVSPGSGSEAFIAYRHRPEVPLESFFESVVDAGFFVERLQNQNGMAIAGCKDEAESVYNGSLFMPLPSAAAVREAHFGAENEWSIQILRLRRAPSLTSSI